MNTLDLIPESIASQLAGVTATTLARFVEAGYLRLHGTEETKHYSKEEICKLFAVDAEALDSDSEIAGSIEVIRDQAETQQEEPQAEKVYWADTVSPERNDSDTASMEKRIMTDSQNGATPELTQANGSSSEKVSYDQSREKTEIIRLRNITMMQDKILELREKEIEDLKKEREWLRTRIEKLEEKSERDQLLLLAETQTIKRLVNITHEKKPSAMRLALEWLGLAPNYHIRQSQSKEIEVK